MTTAALTLTDFLLARIAEDEAAAMAATDGPWTWHPVSSLHAESAGWVGSPGPTTGGGVFVAETSNTPEGLDDGAHIARHDPARVLAECKAHRAIVEEHRWRPQQGMECDGHPGSWMPHGNYGYGYCMYFAERDGESSSTLRALAAIWADHEAYRAEWAL